MTEMSDLCYLRKPRIFISQDHSLMVSHWHAGIDHLWMNAVKADSTTRSLTTLPDMLHVYP